MFIQPFDGALSESEWRHWIATGGKFGVLAIPQIEPGLAPVMVPTHFTLAGNEILLHLARPNKSLKLLENGHPVSLSVVGDYAYIPNQWRAKSDVPAEHGVPTSYYAAVNFALKPTVVSTDEALVEILKAQMADMQPEGGYARIDTAEAPYGPMLSGIRGVRLEIIDVEAKFKYDDHKPVEFREKVIGKLDDRSMGQDAGAADQQQRRLDEIGEWRDYRNGDSQGVNL